MKELSVNSYFDKYFGHVATHMRSNKTQILAEGANYFRIRRGGRVFWRVLAAVLPWLACNGRPVESSEIKR